jgi:hypothetical protein
MDSLRIEIESELKRTRLDKTRLYSLLLNLIDNCDAGLAAGPARPGPPGVTGPPGDTGPKGNTGPMCECKCVTATTPKQTVAAPEPKKVVAAPEPKKVVAAPEPKKVVAKKKVVASA